MNNPADQWEWDAELGEYVKKEDPLAAAPPEPAAAPQTATDAWVQANQRRQAEIEQLGNEMYESSKAPTKPFLAEGPGQAATEVLRQLGNAGTALATDYGDLAAGIGDTFIQGGNALQGKGFDFNEWFNDSDNPWTKGRLEFFEPETQVGDMARPWIRGGVALLTLPKQLLQWGIVTPLKMAAKVPVAGRAATAALKGGSKVKGAVAARTALSADEVAKASGLTQLSNIAAKGTNAKNLPASMARSAWLFASYDDIGKAIKAGAPLQGMSSWFDDVARGVKGLGTSVKNLKLRTVGEALAWDAFVAFNMAGEGNDEFDEGFSNFLVDSDMGWAEAIGSPLATTADDNAITRKFKGMAEGTLMGLVLNPLFDIWRLRRFSKYFKEASPELQDQILKKLSAQAQDIGTSMGEQQMKLLPAAGQSSRPFDTNDLMASVMKRRTYDDEIAVQAEQARAMTALRRAEAEADALDAATSPVPGMNQADYDASVARNNRRLPGAEEPDQAALPGGDINQPQLGAGPQIGQPGRDPAGLPGAGPDQPQLGAGPQTGQPGRDPAGLLPGDQGIEQVNVQVLPRPAEPVITPQTIRNGFAQDARKYVEDLFVQADDGIFRQAEFNIKKLMPRNRVDALEYLQENPTAMNRYFVRDAVDSVWSNFITRKALAEGWATIDPLNMNVKFNRAMAMNMDMSDKTRKLAQDLDNQIDIETYNGNVGGKPDDPASLAAGAQVADDSTKMAQYEASEALRLRAAQSVKGKLSDAEIVREMTSGSLDDVARPIVQKAETGRGWEVIGADGEVLQRTTTKRAAEKLADQDVRAQQEELIRRARQAEADKADMGIEPSYEPVVESDIVSSIKLTQKQKEEIMRYLPRIAQETIDAPGTSIKRSFDFSLSEMEQLADGWKALLQTSDLSPARRRVIKNLVDKFNTSAKLMQPEVRAAKQVDKMLAQTESYIKNGEICDFL